MSPPKKRRKRGPNAPQAIRDRAKQAAYIHKHSEFFNILFDCGSVTETCRWTGITRQSGWHKARKAGLYTKRVLVRQDAQGKEIYLTGRVKSDDPDPQPPPLSGSSMPLIDTAGRAGAS